MAYVAGAKTNADEVLRFTATYNPASLATVTKRTDTVTVTGVRYQDSDGNLIDRVISVVPPTALDAGIVVMRAQVTADDTISVDLYNSTGGSIDVASGTWEFFVGRY